MSFCLLLQLYMISTMCTGCVYLMKLGTSTSSRTTFIRPTEKEATPSNEMKRSMLSTNQSLPGIRKSYSEATTLHNEEGNGDNSMVIEIQNFKQTITMLGKENSQASTDNMLKAFEKITDGVPDMVLGYGLKDWRGTLKGALSVVTGLSRMLGPVGISVASTLKFLGNIFQLLGHAPNSTILAPPSTLSNISMPIDTTEFSTVDNNNNVTNFASIKSLYSSLEKKLQEMRLPNKSAFLISFKQSMELYNYAVEELRYFHSVKEMTMHTCRVGKLSSNSYISEIVKRRAVKCSYMLRGYIAMSIENQLALTNIAVALNSAATKRSKRAASKFINLLKKEQASDEESFRFLHDPIKYPGHRYSVFYFYDNPEENYLAIAYINSLANAMVAPYEPSVVVCENNFLQGKCTSFHDVKNANEVQEMYTSVFVPPGAEIYKITFPRFKLEANHTYNSFGVINRTNTGTREDDRRYAGPFVYQGILTRRFEYHDYGANSFRMDAVETDPSKIVRLCLKYMGSWNIQNQSHCFTYRIRRDQAQPFIVERPSQINSIWIPEGLSVTLLNATENRLFSYIGPFKVNQICTPTQLVSMQISVFKDNDKVLKVCNEERFQGICLQIPVNNLANNSDHTDIFRSLHMCRINTIKSMKVPCGFHVIFFANSTNATKAFNSFKEYTGPISLPDLHIPVVNLHKRFRWESKSSH